VQALESAPSDSANVKGGPCSAASIDQCQELACGLVSIGVLTCYCMLIFVTHVLIAPTPLACMFALTVSNQVACNGRECRFVEAPPSETARSVRSDTC